MLDHDHDLDWLRQHQPHRENPEPAVTARARDALLHHASAADLHSDVSDLPHRHRLRRVIPAVGVAAAAAAIALAVLPTSPGHAPSAPPRSAHARGPLVRLADYLASNDTPTTGDATLVLRTQSYPDHTSYTGADLYTDSGEYFYAETESGLPEQIAQNDDQGGGMFARENAAAVEGATGNVQTAMYDMAVAPNPTMYGQLFSGPNGSQHAGQMDNMVWEDSLDTLIPGAGNSEVREGLLRILSTIPGIKVTNGTSGGQPTLTVTASYPDVPTNYQEQLVINAQSGIPLSFQVALPARHRAHRELSGLAGDHGRHRSRSVLID